MFLFIQADPNLTPKFKIAFDFRFTFTQSCQCFYNNAIQNLPAPSCLGPIIPLDQPSPCIFSGSLDCKPGQDAENCGGATRPLPPLNCTAATATAALRVRRQ
jgi:hypothetical protein